MPLGLMGAAAVLVIARVAMSFVSSPGTESAGLVRWVRLDEAAMMATSTNRPLLIDFTADWCAPCHVLDREVFQDPEMAAEINERFIAVRVTDRQQEDGKNSAAVEALQERYGVNGFPTVVIAASNGDEQARMEGYRGRDSFRRMMESVP
jgi:thiol:disulfide interchange protein